MITALDEKTALVLIDLQKGIVGYPTAHPMAAVLANAAKLVAAFRKVNLPVVVVNVDPGRFKSLHTRKDAQQRNMGEIPAEWFEIAPEIVTQPGDIFITKHTWSAFHETAMDAELQKRGITGIVLAGVSTSIGVEGTGRAAHERGYNISFAVDAMTDTAAEAHERSLKYIFPRMGESGTTDDIIGQLK
ncbi:hydrolase [Mucilaginibacter sp. PPCGB 2223]|uniref:isochorismatase family protein n=1 Tax=Mucilaginibacter sp. PPCGB 2223 TaxID=1886027 RepID=UPI00082463D5|nr:isochorismatase family protein [Mucilaginibacter sp. PPCGB 2223]OCX50512.1 hydrolase [Mucilaginibacter sp. PPCGB 2223]